MAHGESRRRGEDMNNKVFVGWAEGVLTLRREEWMTER